MACPQRERLVHAAHGQNFPRARRHGVALHGKGAKYVDDHRQAAGLPRAVDQLKNLNIHCFAPKLLCFRASVLDFLCDALYALAD